MQAFCNEVGAAADAPDFILCAEELFTNVVLHGFGGAAGHAIEFGIVQNGAELTVTIIDNGPEFDPTVPTSPGLDDTVEDRPIGGLGRYFVSTTMNSFCYHREKDRNHVEFGRKIQV